MGGSTVEAHEDFIRPYKVLNIEANTIRLAIKDVLLRIIISLSKCRGQCHGGSNMARKKSGVAQRILELQSNAVSTHYHAHSFNLGLKGRLKGCKNLLDNMTNSKEVVSLIYIKFTQT